MTDWGLHIYSNITSLINKTSVDKKGFPWNLSENKRSETNYGKGACPVADSLFERSIQGPSYGSATVEGPARGMLLGDSCCRRTVA